jgi:hypothetical protein
MYGIPTAYVVLIVVWVICLILLLILKFKWKKEYKSVATNWPKPPAVPIVMAERVEDIPRSQYLIGQLVTVKPRVGEIKLYVCHDGETFVEVTQTVCPTCGRSQC